jgi:hypothetical protein
LLFPEIITNILLAILIFGIHKTATAFVALLVGSLTHEHIRLGAPQSITFSPAATRAMLKEKKKKKRITFFLGKTSRCSNF